MGNKKQITIERIEAHGYAARSQKFWGGSDPNGLGIVSYKETTSILFEEGELLSITVKNSDFTKTEAGTIHYSESSRLKFLSWIWKRPNLGRTCLFQ